MTSRAALQAVLAERLGSANEARWMVDEVLAADPEATRATELSDAAARTLSEMAVRRLAGEPLQYVLGTWSFRTLELTVDPRALIPRPETEQVVEVALAEARRQARARAGDSASRPEFLVADLGSGTGAIALSIAAELGREIPELRVVACDADGDALALARTNHERVADRHPHVLGQVDLRAGEWFDAVPPGWRGRLRLVVANPPYVSEAEWETIDPEVRLEPYGALVAGAGTDGTPGFADVETVLSRARDWLAPGGVVVAEMAPHQADAARALCARVGYRDVRVERDLAGKARVVVGRR
jgi:release factor glutamine methyltransferase